MRPILKRIAAIFFVVLMMVSNLGLSVGIHYCQGNAKAFHITIGDEPLSCGMKMDMSCEEEPPADQTSLQKQKCCENAYLSFDNSEEFRVQASELTELSKSIATIVSNSPALYISLISEKNWHKDYAPPDLIRDIQTEVQVFLI